MVSDAGANWQAVRTLTAQMLAAARAGDWTEVAQLEARRQALLAGSLRREQAADPSLSDEIRAVLDDDRELLRLTIAAKDGIAERLSELAKGRKAINAYAQGRR